MHVQRNKAVLKKMDKKEDYFVNAPAAECVSYIWDITCDLYSLTGEYDVQQRLQRNVTHLIEQQG